MHHRADRIRNVALVGHRGSGKTSLNEALLYQAGVVGELDDDRHLSRRGQGAGEPRSGRSVHLDQ